MEPPSAAIVVIVWSPPITTLPVLGVNPENATPSPTATPDREKSPPLPVISLLLLDLCRWCDI